ncbi:MAG: transporter substrate-binding domain-containing protein [Propionibacteriaceae bacterium]|jgi:polar amino acid transport system substrate-binding protein|nr:transporter substrate-binding domain-containing protein [Propionibacteriaceae bacterium]
MKKYPLPLAGLLLAFSGLLAGCAGETQASDPVTGAAADGGNSVTADSAAGVQQVLVGTSGAPKPYIYFDDDNNLTGYDHDVVVAIDAYLPDYEFTYEVTEFASIFGGLDAGRYQMGDNNFTRKPEREEKYLFGSEPYVYNWTVVVVAAGNPDHIQTLADLGGKKVYTDDSGGFAQIFFDSYNAAHPDNPIETIYSGADGAKQLLDLSQGVVDFSLLEIPMFDNYVATYSELKDKIDYVQLSQEETQQIQDPYGWFIFPKTDAGQKLADRVDEAIRALDADGTLVALSDKYFGFDMTGR